MRNASPGPRRHTITCQCCGRTIVTAVEELFVNPAVGSPQRFCGAACRQAAWRRRRAGTPENTPLQRRGGRSRSLRTEPDTHRHDTDPAAPIRFTPEVTDPATDPTNT